MFLILLLLFALQTYPYYSTIKNPTEPEMATYPVEILEYIRDRIAESTEDCRKLLDDELRAERKHLRDCIPRIFAGVHTSIENSVLAKNLSDHMLQTETLNRYLEERVSSLERIILQLSLN